MAEEATEQTAPEEEQETTTTEGGDEESYTQADVDNIVNKVRSSLEQKLADTTKQLEGLKKKSMSEQEKAIAEAEERGAEKVRAELESFKRQATIERLLAQKGIEKTDKIARLIDPDVDPEDGVAQLEKDMPQLFATKTVGGGGGRNLDSEESGFSEQYVNEQIQKHGPAWLTVERKKKLDQWRSENYSGVRRLSR